MKLFSKTIRSAFAITLVAALFLGVCSFPDALAVGDFGGKTEINYVSFGASNVNGYALDGYLPEGINLTNKDQMNIYGYQKMPVGSYPYLLAQAFNNALGGTENLSGYKGATEEEPFSNVHVDQLAMSSMRAEELRFLLDDTYQGDGYTAWRFYDPSNPTAQKWFYGAGKIAAGNPNATEVEAIAALRTTYANAIKQADVITFDLGVNNFGVFLSLCHRWDNDINNIDPEIAAKYEQAKAYVTELVVENSGEAALLLEEGSTIDALAYTLVGFCTSFDVIMEKIYTLNPDVTVAVVSIQNLMTDVNIEMDGTVFPIGDLLGMVINAANTYTACISPYSDKYVYANVSEEGRVEFFLEQLLAYDGNPASLDKDMRDCFDLYDNSLYVTNRLQYVVAQVAEPNFVQYVKAAYPFLASVNDDVQIFGTFLAEAPEFPNAADPYRDAFKKLYNEVLTNETVLLPLQLKAYDVLAEAFKAAVQSNTINSAGLFNTPSGVDGKILDYIGNYTLQTVIDAYLNGTLAEDFVLPSDFYQNIADYCGVELDVVMAVACFGVRTGVGNSFYGHPNREGHKQIANTVLSAIENKTSGTEVVIENAIHLMNEYSSESTHGIYYRGDDSFYVALGDSSVVSKSYVESVATALGVDFANLAKVGDTTADTLAAIEDNAAVLAKADLVTVGYTANIFTAEVTYTLQKILMGKPVEEYDWVALLGEEYAAKMESVFRSIHDTFVEQGLDTKISGRNVADMLTVAVEAYAYKYIEHIITYPALIDAVHAVNPEALVVIVGLHNTVENIVIDIDGTEIALGEYVQLAVDSANAISRLYATMNDKTVFVAAPEVETIKEANGASLKYDMLSFVFESILTGGADFATTEKGNEYIAERILAAVTVIDGVYGDADGDGDVDSTDAMLVLQYDALLVEDNEINLELCDVDGDGDVDSTDAMLILQYDALLIDAFPVEK